jgi:hypothetical protein
MFGKNRKYVLIFSHDTLFQGFCVMNKCQKYSNKKKNIMRTCMHKT